MLPVVVCEEDRALRARWLSALAALARQRYPLLRYEALPGGTRELTRALEAESGIMLVILAVTEAVDEGVRLFASVMERNRDNYVLLCLHDAARLNAVLSRCMRPAGILADAGIDAIVAVGMGMRPMQGFAAAGITVLHDAESPTVGAAAERVAAGQPEAMGPEHACHH